MTAVLVGTLWHWLCFNERYCVSGGGQGQKKVQNKILFIHCISSTNIYVTVSMKTLKNNVTGHSMKLVVGRTCGVVPLKHLFLLLFASSYFLVSFTSAWMT